MDKAKTGSGSDVGMLSKLFGCGRTGDAEVRAKRVKRTRFERCTRVHITVAGRPLLGGGGGNLVCWQMRIGLRRRKRST